MEWTNERVLTFIEIMQTEPCLWDPRNEYFKRRSAQNDAWRRVKELLPFKTTVDQMKRKKETLLGYYRIHLNKFKKSLKTGVVYSTSWFAFEAMDSYLREVYERNRTENVDCEVQESTDAESNENEKSRNLTPEVVEETENFYFARKRQPSVDLTPEILPKRQRNETQYMKETDDDECEIFGRLIVNKLKKMRNPNTRDTLMNDINNLVFRTCMVDRVEHQNPKPSPNKTMPESSLHHEVFIPSSSQFTYQDKIKISQSPRQASSPLLNPPSPIS